MVQMQDVMSKPMPDFREGSIVKGRILEVRPREVLVDIGYKSEGVIPLAEFEDVENLEVGDEVDVLLERLENDEGMVVLSKEKAAYRQNWNKIASVFQDDGLIKGKVKSVVKGEHRRRGIFAGLADRHRAAERFAAVRRQHLRFQDRQD
jgi:small subunit ribosomal protein S1